MQSASVILVSTTCYHFGLCDSLSPHRPKWGKQHPVTARFTSWKACSALNHYPHATLLTAFLFTGHFSWLLKSLTSSILLFLWGHWHPLYESCVNSYSWTLCISISRPCFFVFFTTFVLLQYGGAVFSKVNLRREEWGYEGVDGVVGEGRGRLPEGSALWLALSNWLMRKASLCSWQAGDSFSWLRWYTYLGLKCRRQWWQGGLPSHFKGVKKEIRLLHIMPYEIGHRLMHMLQCHINACTGSQILSNTHPTKWHGWVIRGLEEEWGSTCWESMFSVPLTLKFKRNTASLAKWKTTKMQGGGREQCRTAPFLTNDVPPQRLCSTLGPFQVHFFARFCGMTPRSLSIIEWIKTCWKHFFLVCAVDKCGMRSVGRIGNSVQLNLWYESILKINQAYFIYPYLIFIAYNESLTQLFLYSAVTFF